MSGENRHSVQSFEELCLAYRGKQALIATWQQFPDLEDQEHDYIVRLKAKARNLYQRITVKSPEGDREGIP